MGVITRGDKVCARVAVVSTTAYSRSQKTESLPPDGATSGTLYRSNDIPGKKLAYLDHDRIIMRLSEVAIARAAAAKAEETKGAVADMLRHNSLVAKVISGLSTLR